MKIKIIFLVSGVIVTAVVILMLGKPAKVKDALPEVGRGRKYLLCGTTITCPQCNRPLWKTTRDIFSGETVATSQFVPARDDVPQPKPNQRVVCPFDGEDLMDELHRNRVTING